MDFVDVVTERQPKKLILLHHWDTDGLGCAALFLAFIHKASPQTEVVLMNPTINNYFLVDDEYDRIAAEQADVLLTTDINFPVDVIERLEQIVSIVFVFDHHVQTAGIGRPGIQDVRYPGCTLLVSEYLLQPLNLLAVSGMIGDQEDRVSEFPDFYPQVQQVLQDEQLTLEQAIRLTKLIDTTYIIGETEQLHYAIYLLGRDPKSALTDTRLLANEQRIKTDVDRELARELTEVAHGILYQPITSSFSLISEITRARAKQQPDKIILTDQIWGDQASLYVRRRDRDIDLSQVVDLGRSKGFNAGGKREVAGVVLPTAALNDFRNQVIALLSNQ